MAAVQLPALLCLEAMLWAVAFLTFPLRVLAAADRERKVTSSPESINRSRLIRLINRFLCFCDFSFGQLDRLLGEMQGQMERVVRENGDLQQKLRAALKEQAAMEEILDEMEEEQEDAFARIDLLESQVCVERIESISPAPE
jgi:hypothetical protein